MKPAWQAADRAAELLAAARGWRAAGLIDETTLGTIAAANPMAGPRLGIVWRILIFLCLVVGVSTATAIIFISLGLRSGTGVGLTLLCSGLALVVITELIVERCAFQPTGAEAATALLAAAYLCAAAFALLDDLHLGGRLALRLTYPWCAAVFALAAWRWGLRLFAGAAAVFVLLLAAQFPGARAGWIAAATLLAGWSVAAGTARDLSPSHRDGIALVRLVALAALYLAVNYYSVDQRWLEELGRPVGAQHDRAGDASLLLALLGSAIYPPALLAWGLRTRDRLLTVLGIVSAALSLTTIRFYFHVAPLWLVLTAAGAALAGASLLLERWLRSGADGERSGFTAAPLYDEAQRERLLPVAAALTLAPAARSLPDEPPGVVGRGGSFGGGGSSGTL